MPIVLGRAPVVFDDGVYLASVGALRSGGLPFRDVYSSQGPAFLPLLWLGDLLTGRAQWGPRLVPAVAGIGLVVVVHRLACRETDRLGAALASMLVATSGLVLFTTSYIESDGVAAALCSAAVLAASSPGRRRLVAASLLLGGAVAVKSLFALPALLAVVWLVGRRAGLKPVGLVALGAGSVTVGLALMFGWHDVWDQSVGLHLAAGGHLDVGDNASLLRSALRNQERMLVAMAGAVGLGVVWRTARRVPNDGFRPTDLEIALGIWLGAGVVVVLVHQPLFFQHLVVVVPPAAVLLGLHRPPLPAVLALAIAVLPAQGAGGAWRMSVAQPASDEQVVIDLLARVVPLEGTVISDEGALPWQAGRTSPGAVVDLSHVRIDAGDLTTAEVLGAADQPDVCAVLLWSGRLQRLPGLRAGLTDYRDAYRSGDRELLVRDGCRLSDPP